MISLLLFHQKDFAIKASFLYRSEQNLTELDSAIDRLPTTH
jgi:hypothetical protein